MKITTIPASNALLIPAILGTVVVAITYATLTGKQLPLVNNPWTALIALLVVGMTMCALGGISQVSASGHWASPAAILGYLLGAAILVVIITGLAGWKLPLIQTQRDAVLVSALLIGIKVAIGTISYLFHLL